MTRDWRTAATARTVLTAVVVCLGIRAAYLLALYLLGYPDAARYRVESATAVFVAAGALAQLLRRPADVQPVPRERASPLLTWALFCLVVFAVYLPALAVGFLSDDYVLVERASRWDFSAFNAVAFRPLPLFVWAVILKFGGGAPAIHAVNLIVHGTNAYLTFRIADALLPSRTAALAAGLLMATLPIHVEAVAWSSGLGEMSSTLFALFAVLIARDYTAPTSLTRRSALYLAVVAAALSKETAVVTPLLIAIDAWSRRHYPKPLIIDSVVITAAAVAYGAARLLSAPAAFRQPLTKYALQKFVFGTFGGLALPWHIDVVTQLPLVPLAGALVVLLMLCAWFVNPDAANWRVIAGSAGWVLAGALPTVTFFFVAPNLEASRWLYPSAVGWAVLIVALATVMHPPTSGQRARTAISVFGIVLLLGLGAVGIRLHLKPWAQAAMLRDDVERAARETLMASGCTTLTLADLPDAVRGAYVFRNGAPQALLRDVGIAARLGPSGEPCSFRWNGEGFVAAAVR